MLKEQLQKDIDLEAKAEAKKMIARVPAFRLGYESGWYDAGEKYAPLWQAAEEKAAKYEKALKNIAAMGELPDRIKLTIERTITPKTGEDGLHKEP